MARLRRGDGVVTGKLPADQRESARRLGVGESAEAGLLGEPPAQERSLQPAEPPTAPCAGLIQDLPIVAAAAA
jgi:hypothetical protein